MFKANHEVIHFVNPKVQASIGANTYVVSGPSETKQLQDLLPGILNQLGADNIQVRRRSPEPIWIESALGADSRQENAVVAT
mmetsp:Transcript_29146/g.93268  ORF Transcript_29146/g.93268 Transcript_29146/m.93268 type:complete len:82 (-) Transcript_29146:2006-2251(-)